MVRKKKEVALKQLVGWKSITRIMAFCCICLKKSRFSDTMYYKEKIPLLETEIRCEKCVNH